MHIFLTHLEGLPPKETYQPGCDSKTAEVDCISNWEELFCILQNMAKVEGTLAIPYSPIMLLIHLNKPSGISNNSYCQLFNLEDDCAMIAIYSQSIFAVFPGALWVSLIVPAYIGNVQSWLSVAIVETFWSLPLPFCSRHESVIANIARQVHISGL